MALDSLNSADQNIRFQNKNMLSMMVRRSGPIWTRWCQTVMTQPVQISQIREGSNTSRSKRQRDMREKFKFKKELKAKMKSVDVWSGMSIRELSFALEVKVDDLFEVVLSIPECEYIHDDLTPIHDMSLFHKLAKKINFKAIAVKNPNLKKKEKEENLDIVVTPPDPKDLTPRPPVVTIMGHVDHGKTTLLDFLRRSRIVDAEFGGITQHIGAFSVPLSKGQTVTFIDTPGHAAFKQMRSRGAGSTDIVVLVVDACDGVLDQTVESINMVKQSGAAMVVALNKIDREQADPERARRELFDAGVKLEQFGGDVPCVEISALKGTNVSSLVETLWTMAEILELKADYKGLVEGVVLESEINPGMGKTATVLVQRGTLEKGQILVCGQCHGKVRKLTDDQGKEVKQAKPSQAVKVYGWKESLPSAGDKINQVESERRAAEVVKWREKQEKDVKALLDLEEINKKREEDRLQYLDYRDQKLAAGVFKPKYGRFDFKVRKKESVEYTGPPKLSIIVKADVDGSLEAILNCLDSYDEEEVALDLLDFGVGNVTESDLVLAKQFDGIVYAFNTVLPKNVAVVASEAKVPIKQHNIIYKMVDDLKLEVSQRIPMKLVKNATSKAKVLQSFTINVKRDKVPVAGCRVISGVLEKNKPVQVVRGDELLYDGKMISLKHHKDEVNDIQTDKECGVMVDDHEVKFEEGDLITNYVEDSVQRETTWTPPGF